MATHSSILAWKIPWTEMSGGLVCGVTKSQTEVSMHTCTDIHILLKKDHILSFLKYTSEPIDKGLYLRTELPEMHGFLRALDIINNWGK